MAIDGLLRIEVHQAATPTVVTLAGDLDIATAPALDRALDGVHDHVVVDLTHVSFLDARGLRVLLQGDDEARRRGHRLWITRAREAVHRVFVLTGADRRLRILEPVLA